MINFLDTSAILSKNALKEFKNIVSKNVRKKAIKCYN